MYVSLALNKNGTARKMYHRGAFVQPQLQWEGSKYYTALLSICSPRYPACNAHGPIVVCDRPRQTQQFHSISEMVRFKNKKKEFLILQGVFRFSLHLLSETFLILARTERDMIKNVYWFSYQSTRFSCSVSIKLEMS